MYRSEHNVPNSKVNIVRLAAHCKRFFGGGVNDGSASTTPGDGVLTVPNRYRQARLGRWHCCPGRPAPWRAWHLAAADAACLPIAVMPGRRMIVSPIEAVTQPMCVSTSHQAGHVCALMGRSSGRSASSCSVQRAQGLVHGRRKNGIQDVPDAVLMETTVTVWLPQMPSSTHRPQTAAHPWPFSPPRPCRRTRA